MQVDIRIGRGRGRPPKDETEDPREVLPSGVVNAPARHIATKDERSTADLFTIYCRNLEANNGDPIKALVATLHVTEEYATEHLAELHEHMRSCSRSGMSLQEMLERHDLVRENRIAALRSALYSNIPAVRLKAVELLEDVDMTARAARIGSSWDEIVRIAKDKASRRKT